MKRPYFQERSLPARVEKFMSENKHVDLEDMTDHLINNYREFRGKNRKAFMKSVEKAYEWQLYCQQLDQDSGEDIEDSDGGGPDILEITEPDTLPRQGKNTNMMLTKMYKSASANSSPRPKKKNDFFVLDTEGNSSFNGTRTPEASARKKRKEGEGEGWRHRGTDKEKEEEAAHSRGI
ncbi:hypothetical protein O3P69_012964 [Scylla paramamosain]|uniref:NVL2 nucleolin binding domain-containing protein n=1 Tax=Scylla paramamosain TaxID=85552 RepID=A0AAW0TST0_SCYPA